MSTLDAALVARAQDGDQNALSAVYLYAQPLVQAFVSKRVQGADAEDITSEVMLRVFRDIERWSDQGHSLMAWVYRIAHHRVIDHYRRKKPDTDIAIVPVAERGLEDCIIDSLDAAADKDMVWSAFSTLTPEQRRVMEAYYRDERNMTQIADEMSVDIGVVKGRMVRAKDTIRRAVDGSRVRPLPRILFRRRIRPVVRRTKWPAFVWTPERIAALLDLVGQGRSIDTIAAALGVTRIALQVKAKRLRLPLLRNDGVLSARNLADLLGVKCSKTVARWIESRILTACNRGTAQKPIWCIAWSDVYTFLETPNYWMAWCPERITDESLRMWATKLRADTPRWLSVGDVARRCYVHRNVPKAWIAKGWLPAVRYGNWWVREDVLNAWTLPVNQKKGHVQPAVMRTIRI